MTHRILWAPPGSGPITVDAGTGRHLKPGEAAAVQCGEVARIPRRSSAPHAPATPPAARQAPAAPGGIVQLWPAGYVGGAERAMMSILRETPGLPWRGIAVAQGVRDPRLRDELAALAPLAEGPQAARDLVAGADVVLAWGMNDFPAWLPAEGTRPRVVVVSHSTDDSAWAVRLLEDDRLVSGYVAVSRSALGIIPGRRRAEAVVIPNAIDFRRLGRTQAPEAVRAGWGLGPGRKVLGCLNRISSEKDPQALARAIAALPEEWVGVMVGDGFDALATREHAEAIAPGRVIFPGPRLDVGNALAAFDCMLVASLYESFCLSMGEAFAVGTPVVSTPVGIALDDPRLTRPIPIEADGPTIAAAVLADRADPEGTKSRTFLAGLMAKDLWSPHALATAWTAYLAPMIPAPAARPGVKDALRWIKAVDACPDRGCKVGCNSAHCGRFGTTKYQSECIACVRADARADPLTTGA